MQTHACSDTVPQRGASKNSSALRSKGITKSTTLLGSDGFNSSFTGWLLIYMTLLSGKGLFKPMEVYLK